MAGERIKMVVLTLDAHLTGVLAIAGQRMAGDLPGFELSQHMASRWANDPAAASEANRDIADADIVVSHMLFLEDHFLPVIDALRARREHCAAMMGCMSAGEVVKLTRLGKFDMQGESSGVAALIKKMRGKAKGPETSGARQMAMLRRLPKILRFIPGTAQDMRSYFLGMGYLLAGSADNMEGLIRHLVGPLRRPGDAASGRCRTRRLSRYRPVSSAHARPYRGGHGHIAEGRECAWTDRRAADAILRAGGGYRSL